MPLIQSFEDIIQQGGILKADSFKIPSLQSDYVIGIMPSYEEEVNASNFDSVLLTNLGTEYLQNGLKMDKNQWGYSSANMSFSGNSLTFSYIGLEIKKSKKANYVEVLSNDENNLRKKTYSDPKGQYPSLIHYYYQRQLTDQGTLRIKTSDWKLPAIYIFNLRLSSPIYVLKNCRFSMPTFTTVPSSNDFVAYQTTAYYDSFEDWQNTEVTSMDMEEFNTEEDINTSEYQELLSQVSGRF